MIEALRALDYLAAALPTSSQGIEISKGTKSKNKEK
jgi:uncharacterized protein YggU (UPF0235/DUF167 family)